MSEPEFVDGDDWAIVGFDLGGADFGGGEREEGDEEDGGDEGGVIVDRH